MTALIVMACASTPQQGDIPTTANPSDEITKLDSNMSAAVTKNIDVLAPDEFANASKWLAEAKSDVANQKKQDVVLDDVRRGRDYLKAAYSTSENRAEKAPSLFEARQFALKAGAGRHSELR